MNYEIKNQNKTQIIILYLDNSLFYNPKLFCLHIVAYLIHKELYGGGLDTLVLLRASIRNNASFNAFIYSVYKNT